MTDWRYYVATTDGDVIGELTAATGRKVSFKLDAATEASWDLDGRHPDAAAIGELTTDLYVQWRDRTMARLRNGASSDTLEPDTHTCSFGAVDYRGLLERRITYTQLTYTAWELADIPWDLLDYTQNRVPLAGGPMGIGRGLSPTIGDVDYVVPAGKKIGEAIDDLSKLGFGRGFDWQISPGLEFDVWQSRGTDREFVAEYGTNVDKLTRVVDTAEYANAIRASGADGVTAATRVAADLASRPEGRIEAQVGNTDLKNAAAVASTASSELSRSGTIVPSYKMKFRPGASWDPDQLWLGDAATFVVKSGRLNVVGRDRIVQIDVTTGEDGDDVVEITFGTRRQDFAVVQRKQTSRLETLSRR